MSVQMARRQLRPGWPAALAAAAVISMWLAPGMAAASPAAHYRVGAASVDINPTYPVFMGGYGGGPGGGTIARHVDPLTGQPENFSVRAIAIGAGSHVVELARVDTQGWFAGYAEGPYGISDVRQAVAAYMRQHGDPSASEADIIVSALHEHASPTILGIWGPPQHALPYLKQVAAATETALEEAYAQMRPAIVTWGSVDAPWLGSTNLANANANEGWPNDGSLLALWARSADTGRTIATYVSSPTYPNIVFGPGDLHCPSGVNDSAVLSTDFPSYVQNYLEQRFGGIALDASGTLGDQPGPMQVDNQPSTDLPPVIVDGKSCQQTVGFDDAIHMGQIVGNLTALALAHGHTFDQATVGGSEQYVLSPVYNPLLLALNNVGDADNGTPWTELGNPEAYPIDRSTSPPYEVGNAMGTWVTGLRIGDILVLSEPGEFFPSLHQAWNQAIHHAAGVFVIGMGQDQLGYDFPAYAYPFTWYSADQNIYNPSLTLGDQVTTAGEQVAQSLGFPADLTTTAEQTALNNQYARAAQPGIQFIPFQLIGDIDPGNHSFSDVLEAWATPQRFDETVACNPPVVPNLPQCPASKPTIGPINWSFGDGSTYVSQNAAQHEQSYFRHAFCRAGIYHVDTKTTDSNGNSDSFSLPVTVFPPLRPSIALKGGRLVAHVEGGDGVPLYIGWTVGSEHYWGRSAPASASGPISLRVVDGTGTIATVSGTLTKGALSLAGTSQYEQPSLAAGPPVGSSC